MHISQRIAPCLWFDNQAEEAAAFYVSVFRNSKILSVARYPKAGQEIHKRPPGSVMVVDFELDGQAFTALNGGPVFTFNEAVSLQVILRHRRTRSTTTGTSCRRAATPRRSSAVG